MNQQKTIDALAEQNRLLKEALAAMVMEAKARGCGLRIADEALVLPNLSTSILNKRDTRVLQEAIGVCEELLLGRSEFSADEIFGIRCCTHEIERLAAEKEKSCK